jgi:two-component system, NtrC family, sensor kinase
MRWLDRLDSLSYRLKMPMSFAAAAVVAAFVVALGLTFAAFEDSERAFADRAARLAETAARAMPGIVLKDELWSAFELVRGFAATGSPNSGDVVLVVVDTNNRVFVSNDPDAFPVASRFPAPESNGRSIDNSASPAIWQSAPIVSNDDDRIGTVHVRIRRPVLLHEFISRAQSVGIWALIALAFLLPVGWYAGNRMAKPLVQLAEALHRVGANPGSQSKLPEHPAMDEVGLVTRRFNEMTRELAQSDALKQEIYRAERLAAVGRLAGGVAHEINNPLAGLLNAIDTQRRHGARDAPLGDRTLDLLERGLNQIRQTVAALLVEVRAGDDQLTLADFDDLMTLVEPGRAEKDLSLKWEVDLTGPVALPAAQVRQVALNLLLNAMDATPRGGRVQLAARIREGSLHLVVSDQGRGFAAESLSHVFEPFQSTTHGGEGMGLWVTHQLVQDLNGDITVARKDDHTVFQVKVPITQGVRYDATNLSH